MYDRDTAMLEKYDLSVKNIRKVRGGWLCVAQEGLFLWKESRSGEERLNLEDAICRKTEEMGISRIWGCAGGSNRLRMDRFVRNREGQLLTEDERDRKFVLKQWTEGRECDVKNTEDLYEGARAAACMHQMLRTVKVDSLTGETGSEQDVCRQAETEQAACGQAETGQAACGQTETGQIVCGQTETKGIVFEQTVTDQAAVEPQANPLSLAVQESYEELWNRRKREISRVQSYVRKRRNKNAFEQMIMKETPYFSRQAQEALELLNGLPQNMERYICHGDFHYHNLVFGKQETWICQSSRFHLGYQITDFYLFLRKCMEKQGWNWQLAEDLLNLYRRICPVTRNDLQLLYCLFLFPEKYWKQLNFYVQSNKAWMPEKNVVKLRNLIQQEEHRQEFLEKLYGEMV